MSDCIHIVKLRRAVRERLVIDDRVIHPYIAQCILDAYARLDARERERFEALPMREKEAVGMWLHAQHLDRTSPAR